MRIAFVIALTLLAPRASYAHEGREALFGLDIGYMLNDTLAHIQAGNGGAFWTAMLLAFTYGILHAIGPGHGKIVVASYFSSRKASYTRGAMMGLQVAFFHVLSAIVLVVAVQELAKFAFGIDDGLRYIKIIGYGAVFAIGAFMLANASRSCACGCCGHEREEKRSGTAQWLLALGIGIVPCPGVLALLFYAMSNRMLWIGICAVLFMAFGMAVTLCVIGMASIFARRKIAHEDCHGAKPDKSAIWFRRAGALLIMALGLTLLLDSILYSCCLLA